MVDYIAEEFSYAKDNGWLDTFIKCAKDYDWPAALLMAIASRETNMKNIVGDRGHGYGCMQIDVGSYPEFCHSGLWKDPLASIEKGTQVLEEKRTQIGRGIGKTLSIGGYHFVGKPFVSQDDLNKVAVACYNCGLWGYYAFSYGEPIDRFDTGHNYSDDVVARAAEFAKLLAAETGAVTPDDGPQTT